MNYKLFADVGLYGVFFFAIVLIFVLLGATHVLDRLRGRTERPDPESWRSWFRIDGYEIEFNDVLDRLEVRLTRAPKSYGSRQ